MRKLQLQLDNEALDQLLDPGDPALRTRVLTDLCGRRPNDRDVLAAKKQIPQQTWVRKTLAAHNGDGTWGRGFYHKYDGTSWSLLHLSEVGAPMDHPALEKGVQRLINTARPVDPANILITARGAREASGGRF